MHKTTLALAALMIMPNAVRSEICEFYAAIQTTSDFVSKIDLASDYDGEPDRVMISMDRPTEQEILAAHLMFNRSTNPRAVCLEQDVGYECFVTEEDPFSSSKYRIRDNQMVVSFKSNSPRIVPNLMIFNCD